MLNSTLNTETSKILALFTAPPFYLRRCWMERLSTDHNNPHWKLSISLPTKVHNTPPEAPSQCGVHHWQHLYKICLSDDHKRKTAECWQHLLQKRLHAGVHHPPPTNKASPPLYPSMATRSFLTLLSSPDAQCTFIDNVNGWNGGRTFCLSWSARERNLGIGKLLLFSCYLPWLRFWFQNWIRPSWFQNWDFDLTIQTRNFEKKATELMQFDCSAS